jgi:hypothetical protein
MVCPIHGLSYPWFVLSMVCPVHGLSCPWFVLPMVCPVHGLSGPWFVLSMVCPVHGSSCSGFVVSRVCPVLGLPVHCLFFQGLSVYHFISDNNSLSDYNTLSDNIVYPFFYSCYQITRQEDLLFECAALSDNT